jgi:5-methyltetrahydrofolate--homocysteine methyltransferase
MAGMDALVEAIVEMQEDNALELTQKYLDDGESPLEIFGAYRKALEVIGDRFEKKIYFIPELIMSGELMNRAAEIIKPYMDKDKSEGGSEKIGKVLIATVAGDIHDIGKNIVTMLLDINGFEVNDLGVDVPTQKIVEEAKTFQPDIVGLSGLLTLAFAPMKEVVQELDKAGLRNDLKVIIGGGQLDAQVSNDVGADAWVTDAVKGVNICKEWMAA